MTTREPDPDDASRRTSVVSPQLYQFAGLGLQFAVTILVFGALGYWLDTRLGTRPWLMIVGVFAGFAGGLLSLIRRVPPARTPSSRARAAARPDEGESRGAPPHDPSRPPTPERTSDPDSTHSK